MMDKHSTLGPFLALFRFSMRRIYFKVKLMPLYRKWILVLVILFTLLLLFLKTRNQLPVKISENIKKHTINDNNVEIGNNFEIKTRAEVVSVVSEELLELVNEHNFNYVINEETKCLVDGSFSELFLLILVSSAPKHKERRLAIRQTWGNKNLLAKVDAVLVFLLGSSSDPTDQLFLERERLAFRDIVQEDFVDSYYNLSLKSVMGLKWTKEFCPNANFVMKTDDDVYVNANALVDFLQIYGRRRWIGGCIKQVRSPPPVRSPSGAQLDMSTVGHPPFTAGAGYVLSGDIVPELFEASRRRPIVPVEDAFITAYCAQMIGITPTHYDGFNCGEPVVDLCKMKLKFVGHHVAPEMQTKIWKVLHDIDSRVCSMLSG